MRKMNLSLGDAIEAPLNIVSDIEMIAESSMVDAAIQEADASIVEYDTMSISIDSIQVLVDELHYGHSEGIVTAQSARNAQMMVSTKFALLSVNTPSFNRGNLESAAMSPSKNIKMNLEDSRTILMKAIDMGRKAFATVNKAVRKAIIKIVAFVTRLSSKLGAVKESLDDIKWGDELNDDLTYSADVKSEIKNKFGFALASGMMNDTNDVAGVIDDTSNSVTVSIIESILNVVGEEPVKPTRPTKGTKDDSVFRKELIAFHNKLIEFRKLVKEYNKSLKTDVPGGNGDLNDKFFGLFKKHNSGDKDFIERLKSGTSIGRLYSTDSRTMKMFYIDIDGDSVDIGTKSFSVEDRDIDGVDGFNASDKESDHTALLDTLLSRSKNLGSMIDSIFKQVDSVEKKYESVAKSLGDSDRKDAKGFQKAKYVYTKSPMVAYQTALSSFRWLKNGIWLLNKNIEILEKKKTA